MSGDLDEHRFNIATAGRGMNVLYNCTVGVQLSTSLYHFEDYLRPGETVEEAHSSGTGGKSIFSGIQKVFSKLLMNKYSYKGKWPAFMKGQVYQVEVFVNTCYSDVQSDNRYYINEFGLVPLDVPFIRKCHKSMGLNTTPFPQMIASEYAEYVKAYHQEFDFP